MRHPTIEEYRSYNGAHCTSLWKQCGEDWRCPGCGRTKFQIMRWTRRGTSRSFWGWMAGLHTHYHHRAIDILGYVGGRFQPIVICDQCNSVDAMFKREYRNQIDQNFSFSPEEIRRIVWATP